MTCWWLLFLTTFVYAQGTDGSVQRKTFELVNAFEYYSNTCESFCGNVNKTLSPNICPKCSERYSPCNNCCTTAASSLKMRWHGICEGNLRIATAEETNYCKPLPIDMQEKNEIAPRMTASFLRCSCYESFLSNGYLDDGCALTLLTSVVRDEEFCIVSVNGDTIDLTQPLPNPLILMHTSNQLNQQRPDMNEDLVTAIDTSCVAIKLHNYI
jgi:hypothetical protein